MHLKFKGIIGTMSLVLGVILVISGTFGAFNDIEVINNTFAVGYCKSDIVKVSLAIDQLTPGKSKSGHFVVKNTGTLDINQINMYTDYFNYIDPNDDSDEDDFAKQFTIQISLHPNGSGAITHTLYDLKMYSDNGIPFNITSLFGINGILAEGEEKTVYISTAFDNTGNKKKYQDDSLSVRFRVESICGDIEIPEDPEIPGIWDKSSLQFPKDSPVGFDGTNIYATIKNDSENNMQGPVTYEVYWIEKGNPKDGVKVGDGSLQLDAWKSTILTYNPKLNPHWPPNGSGEYKFRAFQRPGHQGKPGELPDLWSDSITVP